MEVESCVPPPGFRFHPTEEELVGYYLKRKVDSVKIDLDVIANIDLYRMEPWDIEGKCKFGYEEQNEWYFFSYKDRKYPTGMRTNRATAAGFWKATGRDKAVLSKDRIIGMRKTLVFYKGRAPNGRKTDWIMHEYRLQSSEHAPPQEEGWVVCRAFKKPIPNQNPGTETWHSEFYPLRQHNSLSPPSLSDVNIPLHAHPNPRLSPLDSDRPLLGHSRYDNRLLDLPHLDSPTSLAASEEQEQETRVCYGDGRNSGKQVGSKAAGPSLLLDPDMPEIPCDGDLYDEDQMSQLFGCFPDF